MEFTPEIDAILAKALAELNEPLPELEFDPEALNFDPLTFVPAPAPTGTAPAPAPIGTRKISIRIKARTLEAIKTRAKSSRKRYQALINEVLQAAVRDWTKPHV